jgi:hypothetical protein
MSSSALRQLIGCRNISDSRLLRGNLAEAALGAPKAITAMAHRLARLVYRTLKYGQQYVDKGGEYYEHRNPQQQIEFVRKKAT